MSSQQTLRLNQCRDSEAVNLPEIVVSVFYRLLEKDKRRVNRLMLDRIIKAFLEEIADLLAQEKAVKLSNFGKFRTTIVPERKNFYLVPNGQYYNIPAYRQLIFAPSEKLKHRINGRYLDFKIETSEL